MKTDLTFIEWLGIATVTAVFAALGMTVGYFVADIIKSFVEFLQ